jgi:D-alanine-D-alanine ligase
MRVLVLHSEVADDAPPEEMDTLISARAVAAALQSRGHDAALAPFTQREADLRAAAAGQDVVFNLVEGIGSDGSLAYLAPEMLEKIGVPYTGTGPAGLIATQDKPATKRRIRAAGIATADWAEPPDWGGLSCGCWIVKRADEDSSIGLDDACVVAADAVRTRASLSEARWGGRWFAEAFVEGREFNVGVIEENGGPRVLPMAEMLFEDWPEARPRIVGYAAKWHEDSHQSVNTVRRFGIETREPALAGALAGTAKALWQLFGLRGFVRVDYRVDETGAPQVLEINPNPCIAPDGGFAVAAGEAGLSYAETVEQIVREALR